MVTDFTKKRRPPSSLIGTNRLGQVLQLRWRSHCPARVVDAGHQAGYRNSIDRMTSLNIALKSEIARVARKELKDELTALRKTTASHRSEIAALKRDLKSLRSQTRLNEQSLRKVMSASPSAPNKNPARTGTFNAEVFAAKRAKLGLSQSEMARLVEASSLSVYKWESGKVQPRAAQLGRILAIQKIGTREATARLGGQTSP